MSFIRFMYKYVRNILSNEHLGDLKMSLCICRVFGFFGAIWLFLRVDLAFSAYDYQATLMQVMHTAEVITDPECRSKFRKESTIFAEAGPGPGVKFLNENRTRSRSENFSFYRSRIIDFIKFKLPLNG